ncbi:hypothetical protein ACHAWF_002521 [Thalassiosira exigua]
MKWPTTKAARPLSSPLTVLSERVTADRAPHQPDHLTSAGYTFAICLGFCMAFVAGYSNGVSLSNFLDDAAPVAGVTNLITKTSIAVAKREKADQAAGILFSAMAGAFLSGLLNPRPVAFVLSPRYGPTFLLGSAFSALGAVSTIYNQRREFFFLAFGNGVMNGITSMYSANLLRVSSFSGPVTDIGVYFGQLARGNHANAWRLYVLVGLFLAFWLGGIVGYEAAAAERARALVFNALFFFGMGCSLVTFFVVKKKLTFFEALFGLGKVGVRFKKIEVRRQSVDVRGMPIENKTEPVPDQELLELYDSLLEREGEVNEDALMNLLASHDLEVKKHRRSILGIIQCKMAQCDQDGDWTICRDDWKKLVSDRDALHFAAKPVIGANSTAESDHAAIISSIVANAGSHRASQPTAKESIVASINSSRQAPRSRKLTMRESIAASIDAIRLASIVPIESTGWVVDEGDTREREEYQV